MADQSTPWKHKGTLSSLTTCSPPNMLLWTCAFSWLSSLSLRGKLCLTISHRNRFTRLLIKHKISLNGNNWMPVKKNIGEQVDWPFLNPPHSFISCIVLHRYVKVHKIWKISFNLKSFLQFPDEVKPQEREGNMLQAFLDSKQQAARHTPDDRKWLCIWSQLPLKRNPASPPWLTAKGGSASENILLKHDVSIPVTHAATFWSIIFSKDWIVLQRSFWKDSTLFSVQRHQSLPWLPKPHKLSLIPRAAASK